jgi:ABC-type branched-subunit amino acid transport system substrate-binding protein
VIPIPRFFIILLAAVLWTACPQRFTPAAVPVITSPNAQANRHFNKARSLFDLGELKRADTAFAAFQTAYAADPLVPLAKVYQGRIALQQGRLEQAKSLFAAAARRKEDDPLGMQARYYYGITLIRLRSYEQGYSLLRPYHDLVADEERPGLLFALAQGAQGSKKEKEAIKYYQEIYETTSRPLEKQYAKMGLQATIEAMSSRQRLRQLYHDADRDSLTAALAGRKLAALEAAAGNKTEATQLLTQTKEAREVHEVDELVEQEAGPERQQAIGLLVPFSGKYAAAGKKLMLGAVQGSGILASERKIALAIRDSSLDCLKMARELILQEQVVALAGTFDPHQAHQVAQIAAEHGVPFLSFAPMGLSRTIQPMPLQILPDNEQRATLLAQYAFTKLQLRRVAILFPKSRYGEMMTTSFVRKFQGLGGTIVLQLSYSPNTISFTTMASTLARQSFDGLFVPDTSQSLALLTPALAGAQLWAASRGASSAKSGRTFQLLATADGASRRLLDSAGRYVQGAILAPGFFPDESSPQRGNLTQQLALGLGHPPSLLEALGFDSIHLLRTHVERGMGGRSQLTAALRSRPIVGLTGNIRFGSDGRRLDEPLLYQVQGQQLRQL